jgi:hypothetical protein
VKPDEIFVLLLVFVCAAAVFMARRQPSRKD